MGLALILAVSVAIGLAVTAAVVAKDFDARAVREGHGP